MLVSPLEMRTACQIVRAPRATPTVLKEKQKHVIKSTVQQEQGD